MRIDWLPFSASALVAGATALAVGALLTPTTGGVGELLLVIQDDDQRWLAVATLYFISAVSLTVGLPSILTLLDQRTARLGLLGIGVFAVGCLGTAGYAMLLAFFRAMALNDAVIIENLGDLTSDPGLTGFLVAWLGAFFLGELIIAGVLLRARTVAPWVPLLLVGHVVSFPLMQALPPQISSLTVLMATLGFCGIGIGANSRHLVTTAT